MGAMARGALETCGVLFGVFTVVFTACSAFDFRRRRMAAAVACRMVTLMVLVALTVACSRCSQCFCGDTSRSCSR